MVEGGTGAGDTLASGCLGISTEHIGHRVADKRDPAGNLAKFVAAINIVMPCEWEKYIYEDSPADYEYALFSHAKMSFRRFPTTVETSYYLFSRGLTSEHRWIGV